MRQRPGRAARVGDADRHGKPGAEKPFLHVFEHRRLAVEEVGGAGDIQHQPVIAVEPGMGRVACRPAGKHGEKPPVGVDIGGAGDEIRHIGAGIREPHAALQPLPLGLTVEGVKPVVIALVQGDGKRAINRTGSQKPFARKPAKPHGYDAPLHPTALSNCYLFLFCSL